MQIADDRAQAALRRRAYELADSGNFDSAVEIRRALTGEGWISVQPVIGTQYMMCSLSERIRTAKPH